MKTTNVKAMGFGFSVVNSGQRNVNVEPQVIAVSTDGGFRITPPVSKALNISTGDYVMFLNNIDNIDAAILAKAQEVVDFCNDNELELGSAEAAIAIHKEFDMWAIAKGILEYDSKGNQKTTLQRLTKADKIKFVSQNFDDMITAAMADADDETKDALSRAGITKDEQIEILTAFVTPNELPKYRGSKAANSAGLTGAGTSLNFTDSNVWRQLKADMGENAGKMNRVFDIDIDTLQDVTLSNGYSEVIVKALVLGDYSDKEPSRIGKATDETAE